MPNNLVISAPRQGIAPSPHVGFGDVRNLDIFSIPGVALLNNSVAKKSVAIVTGLVQWIVKHPTTPTTFFGLDADGVVYTSTNSGTTWTVVSGNTAGGKGQGLAIWKDYLFVAYTAGLDVYGPISGTPTWSKAWKTIDSDALWHPMIVSKNDNKLYGGAGRYVFSLDENSGQTFVPATSATYTFTQQALDLPPNYRIKCLEELGNNLMCGTWMGANVYDLLIADIFPWDRTSVSFGQPIVIVENGIHAMLTIGSYMIVMAGIGGAIYKTYGADAVPIAQIPNSICNLDGGKNLLPHPGAIINFKGRPFFGVSGNGTDAISGMGVWSLLQTSRGNILTHEHTISTGTDGTSYVVKIGALCGITRDNLLIGWSDATPTASYGIDNLTVTSRVTSYGGYFESPFYTVGSNKKLRKFEEMEFQFARPLRVNEGIKVEYRTDLAATFTEIDTYDYATWGAVVSKNIITELPTDIKACEQIQLKISLTGTTTSPHFKSLTLL
jgi:hypothetical protein